MKTTGIKCKKCNTTIYSRTRHDFRYCACESCFVDGGRDYFRYGGNFEDFDIVELDIDVERKDLDNDYRYGLDNYGLIKQESQVRCQK